MLISFSLVSLFKTNKHRISKKKCQSLSPCRRKTAEEIKTSFALMLSCYLVVYFILSVKPLSTLFSYYSKHSMMYFLQSRRKLELVSHFSDLTRCLWVHFLEQKTTIWEVFLELDKQRWRLSLSFIDYPIKVIYSVIHLANCSSSQSVSQSLDLCLCTVVRRCLNEGLLSVFTCTLIFQY